MCACKGPKGDMLIEFWFMFPKGSVVTSQYRRLDTHFLKGMDCSCFGASVGYRRRGDHARDHRASQGKNEAKFVDSNACPSSIIASLSKELVLLQIIERVFFILRGATSIHEIFIERMAR